MRRLREWHRWHSIRSHVVAAIWLRVPEKARWSIVHRLNKSERRGWCDLVDAALATREDDLCDVATPIGCASTTCATSCFYFGHTGRHDCSCYCGKFRFAADHGWEDKR